MNIFRSSNDENCVDWDLRFNLGLPADKIIKELMNIGHYVEELAIDPTLYNEFKLQMGSRFDTFIYSPWGKTKLVARGPDPS